MGLEYGKFLTPELQQELERLGKKYGYSPGHFHVAFSLAQTFAGKSHKSKLRDNLRFLIQHPEIDQNRLDSWLTEQLASAEGARRHEQFRLRTLAVRNFGPFQELTMQFADGDGRPITLVGAPNGRGKTTLFRALRAALYGLEAETGAERSPLYNDGENGSAIQFTLEMEDGEGKPFQIQREYHYRTGRGRPVLTNQQAFLQRGHSFLRDDLLSEEVEQFLPRALAGYFFFDADKQIEQFLRDQQGALRQGIERILGIERLNDLEEQVELIKASLTKERRRINEANAGNTQKQIQEQLDKLDERERQLQVNREQATSRLRQIEEDLAVVQNDIEQLLIEFDPQRHEEYDRVTRELGARQEELKRVTEEIERLARETLPLLLVLGELDDLHSQVQVAQVAGGDSGVPRVVSDLYERAKVVFRRYDYDEKHLENIFSQYREQLKQELPTETTLEYTQQQIRAMETLLQQSHEVRIFTEGLSRRETLLEDVERLQRKQGSLIPPKTDLAERNRALTADRDRLIREQAESRQELRQIEDDLKQVTAQQAECRQRAGLADDYGAELVKIDQDLEQIQHFMSFVKGAGKAFRSSQIHVLAEQASEAYRLLTNKPDINRHIAIDPDNFAATLREGDAEKALHELSAGEQQVFAMALVAGLARTSQRKVPMIIDTPFGRLDSEHRHNICRDFLPTVAPQVVVLSTNTEIVGGAYELVTPHVGKTYVIDRHATGKEHSYLREGYFQ